jgi:RimJ/RimL family protein N-acetyltransferase
MIHTAHQDLLLRWLFERTGYMPTPWAKAIANVTAEGKILGVVAFDAWNGASCEMHVAGQGNWLTRGLLRACFEYVFKQAELKVVIGMVPSTNAKALRFDRHIGFSEVARIKDGVPDGDLVVMQLRREDCRYLEKEHEQTHSAAA